MASSITSGTLTNYNNAIQLMGGSSGLDVSGLINATMQAERLKIDPLYTSQEKYTQKKDVWSQFKTQMSYVLQKADELKDLTSLNQTISTSKDGIVDVTAKGDAVAGSYGIKVSQLATSHKVMSDAVTSATEPLGFEGTLRIGDKDVNVTMSMTIKDIAKEINKNNVGADATVVGGHLFMTSQETGETKEIQISSTNDAKRVKSSDYGSVGVALNGDIAGLNESYSLTVEQVATKHKVESNAQLNSSEILNYAGSFTIGGVEIKASTSDTLSDIAKKINSNTEVGVKASVVNNKLVLEAKETGLDNAIVIQDNTSSVDRSVGLFQHIGLTDGTSVKNVVTEAKDSLYTVDGVSQSSSTNTIDSLTGLKIELKAITTSPITINVEQSGVDIAQSLGLLTSTGAFKNEMQAGQDALYTIEGIEKTSSTNTITDAISDMTFQLLKESDEEVQVGVLQDDEALATKVKEFVSAYNSAINFINSVSMEEGVLQGDSLIRSAKASLRSILYESAPNGMMMFQIGIQGDSVARDGTIQFNESTFKEALEKDYDKVMEMLTGENGVSDIYYDKINEFTKASGMIDLKTESLLTSINRLQETIERKEENFTKLEERLVEKYAKMESALSSLNSTKTYLTSQIESWNNSDN